MRVRNTRQKKLGKSKRAKSKSLPLGVSPELILKEYKKAIEGKTTNQKVWFSRKHKNLMFMRDLAAFELMRTGKMTLMEAAKASGVSGATLHGSLRTQFGMEKFHSLKGRRRMHEAGEKARAVVLQTQDRLEQRVLTKPSYISKINQLVKEGKPNVEIVNWINRNLKAEGKPKLAISRAQGIILIEKTSIAEEILIEKYGRKAKSELSKLEPSDIVKLLEEKGIKVPESRGGRYDFAIKIYDKLLFMKGMLPKEEVETYRRKRRK